MASKTLLYNVTAPVGRACVNAGDDVLLVRFFLKRLSQSTDLNGPCSDMPLVPGYDPALTDGIKWFQKSVAAAHFQITVDGRVDPAPHGQGIYTIRHMNASYRRRYPQFRDAIEGDPVFPQSLRAAFQNVAV